MQQIGQAYDFAGNGVLTFDEFLQFRLEWDNYLSAWDATVPPGRSVITDGQVLHVLERIKESLEPFATMASQGHLCGLTANYLDGLYYRTMFSCSHTFLPRTCELLVTKFGFGNPYLTFEQFCLMMEFLNKQKKVFAAIDLDRNGTLELNELVQRSSLLPMRVQSWEADKVLQIARQYDQRGDGCLHFDEFLQMMIEWESRSTLQQHLLLIASVLALLVVSFLLESMVLAMLILSGVALAAWISWRSHWGEFERMLPAPLQKLGYKYQLVWIVIAVLVAAAAAFICL